MLLFIQDHKTIAEKVVARVHWALVFGILQCRHPVPDQIVGLESIDQKMQYPVGVSFPL